MSDKAITTDKLTKKFGDFIAVNEISFEVNKITKKMKWNEMKMK